MSSRNGIPNQLNASLIREVRMIAQQFFRHKSSEAFWNSSSKAVPALKCCFCVDTRKRPLDASEVIRGYSVCSIHANYVRGDEYTEILRNIQRSKP